MVELRGETPETTNWRLRIALAIVGILTVILVYTLVYRWAMLHFAGEERSLLDSAQVVIEILTTAGFGGDTEAWRAHDALSALVILMNLSGVLLVFLAIPLFAVPLFRQALSREPPTETTLEDHVIICGHSAVDDVLRAELESAEIPYLFVESDPEKVKRLNDEGDQAIYGDAERVETLKRANAELATALVADLDDETNPTVILSADRVNPDLHIISVVATREAAPHHRYAGADEVVVSKEGLGESLALRSMKTVSEQFSEAIDVENGLDFAEYLVPEGSDLIGQQLDEVDFFAEHSITIIGGWFGAKFLVSPRPNTVILENSILLVSGAHEALEKLDARRLPSHLGHPDRVVVCGYGDVGKAVTRTLREEGIDTTVVDKRDYDGVDLRGDITTRQTLSEANLENARAIILAVNSDVTSIYSAIFIKQLEPDIELIARANDAENVWKLYNAGADYVLSLPSVTGEILASTLIGEEILTPHDEFEFVRTTAPGLTGQTIAEADIRNKTGCTVVAIEREGSLVTDVGAATEIDPEDVLIAAGSPSAVEDFRVFVDTTDELEPE